MDSRNEALKIITARKRLEEANARDNLTKALKDAEFARLYNGKMELIINSAKQGETANTQDYDKKINERLQKLGITSIIPKYDCEVCQDSGYIEGRVCSCLKRQQSLLLIKNSGFGQMQSFADVHFDIFENSQEMQKIYTLMKNWCHSDFKKKIIYLAGYPGTGKTYLIQCMANELINLGKEVIAISAYKLSQDILRGFASKDIDEKDSIMQNYFKTPVLFIDDLGTEQGASSTQNSIIQSGLYYIINERKNSELPTVITTNLDFGDFLANYDERITSRIADDSTIKLQLLGKDLRFKGKI